MLNTHVRDEFLETAPAKVTTAGDSIYATGANALARLGIGTAGQVWEVNAGATAPQWGVGPSWPWLIDVDVYSTAIAQTNWDTNVVDASAIYNAHKRSSGAQNDEISFDLLLHAGTWTVELTHIADTNVGIYSVQFDTVEKGTIDWYAAAPAYNQRSSVSGIVVAASAKSRLKLKMATKNAASSNYYGLLEHIQLRRTA